MIRLAIIEVVKALLCLALSILLATIGNVLFDDKSGTYSRLRLVAICTFGIIVLLGLCLTFFFIVKALIILW